MQKTCFFLHLAPAGCRTGETSVGYKVVQNNQLAMQNN